ncbi:hypothetical protein G9F71_009860 [Clostridium sp. FP2]|uniref:hypothetical protein n=1 Tax=Clostridium sp. FP2 TaxID=2724481 RepID=UPI0013E91040|nr:hypothetical protein [Clostridium sp. FP2]MBZ9623161.1 hypothetical protein [Clostridium sp. FP2]
MKIKAIIVAVAVAAVFTGCAKKAEPTIATKTDVVTSASFTKDPEILVKGMGKDGNWIIGITDNMTTKDELVLEGDNFKKADKKDPTKKVLAGKHQLVLMARDDKKVTTANYTLTAKRLTVKSKNGKIEGGTFKGDVYVESTGFSLEAAKIDGNIYFANEDDKKSFKMDDKSSVTGKQEIKK